ncbi:hypothetical protein LTR36_009893 [Oleoguttula mirabilis]|uniref:Uncharacterized protein n=1 Tax=Oleoguttula mirabilis TaxID=1507867 RepID=A0AAV9J5E6_9PEZI|nr:hypothetical protein LTR36_009893 [Oleoguttula mirabilis]
MPPSNRYADSGYGSQPSSRRSTRNPSQEDPIPLDPFEPEEWQYFGQATRPFVRQHSSATTGMQRRELTSYDLVYSGSEPSAGATFATALLALPSPSGDNSEDEWREEAVKEKEVVSKIRLYREKKSRSEVQGASEPNAVLDARKENEEVVDLVPTAPLPLAVTLRPENPAGRVLPERVVEQLRNEAGLFGLNMAAPSSQTEVVPPVAGSEPDFGGGRPVKYGSDEPGLRTSTSAQNLIALPAEGEPSNSASAMSTTDSSTSCLSTLQTSQKDQSLENDLATLNSQLSVLLLEVHDRMGSPTDSEDSDEFESDSVSDISCALETSQPSSESEREQQRASVFSDVLPLRTAYVRQAAGNKRLVSDTPSTQSQSDGCRRGIPAKTSSSKRASFDTSSWDQPEEDGESSKRPRRQPEPKDPREESPPQQQTTKIPCFVDDCPGKDSHVSEVM